MRDSSGQASQIFAALADGTRFSLLQRLQAGERRVGELCEESKLAQSLISFHLKTLREAGLVRSRREGRTIWYSLDPHGIGRLSRLLDSLRAERADYGAAARAADLELCQEYINDR